MEEYYCDIPLTNAKVLCIGSITSREAATLEPDFCDGTGTYLYLADASDLRGEVEVIARVVSEEAAERLRAALTGKFMPKAQPIKRG
jgi:hypothetical protein